MTEQLTALSVLDGRYARLTQSLNDIFSEYGLIKYRVFVEIQWLKFMITELRIIPKEGIDMARIDAIASEFTAADAETVKATEKITNHDVKAVEYYIKEILVENGMAHIKEWIHFACTSEDINNTAYALMLKAGRDCICEECRLLVGRIESIGKKHRKIPMMSRTHGQPATPTTVGKEFINFAWRLRDELAHFNQIEIQAKMNGATGNFNAHHFVFPEIDWIAASEKFLSDYLGLAPLLFTTQINPYSYISRLMHSMVRMATIIIDLDRDIWGYISFGYFKQKLKVGEVGSSTMPHKVNPIDFENSEGNMGVAVSMMEHLATKLLTSRFQRDLSDSTVLRNLGAVCGYFLIGLKNTVKGLDKLDLDAVRIEKDLDQNWELLAEPIQTVMRVCGEENPYEKLKALTRGKKIRQDDLNAFVDTLAQVPASRKKRIQSLSPATYIGMAVALVDRYLSDYPADE